MSLLTSPIDMLKNKVSGFSFDNDFLDTLVGAKIRNIGEAAEDSFYGMFGSLGMKALDAKEAAEQQQVVAGKVSFIYPNKKLRKKMLALIIRKLVMKASARGVKDKDQQERIEKVKRAITAANDLGQLLKAIKQAVRLEPSVAGAVDKFYEEALQMGEDEDFDSLADNMNMDDPKGANAVKQMLIDAKQADFQEAVREDPKSLTPEYIKKHQDEVQDIIKLDSDELRKYLKNVGKNEAPQIKDQFKEIAIQSALGTMPTVKLSTPSAPSAGRTSRQSSQQSSQVERSSGNSEEAPEVGRQQSRAQLTQSAGSSRPNLQSFLGGTNGTDSGMAAGLGDEIASGLGEASSTLTSGELVMAMDRLEGALVELANMLSSGEIKPEQIGEAFGGLIEPTNTIEGNIEEASWEDNTIEGNIEEASWKDNMLDNTIAIKEALESGSASEEPKKDSILGKLFDGMKNIFDVKGLLGKVTGIFSMIGPVLTGIGTMLSGALAAIAPMILPALAVAAAGFVVYKTVKWFFEDNDETNAKNGKGDKVFEEHQKSGKKYTKAEAGALSLKGVNIDSKDIMTNEEAKLAEASKSPSSELITQKKTDEQINAELEATEKKKIGNVTSIGPTTTINNKTVMPQQSHYAPVRTGDSAITRAKDRYAIVR